MIYFLKPEIVANMGKLVVGILRQVIIALMLFLNGERKPYAENEGRKCSLGI